MSARFVVTEAGGDSYVLDRAYCYRRVRVFGHGKKGRKLARACASALNVKHGPWPVVR